jgi:hypothetical protein
MFAGFTKHIWVAGLALAVTAAGTATTASAQSGSATVYRDRNFSGPAVAASQANSNMRLNFRISSVRISGAPWELCPEPNFRGKCLIVGETTSDMFAKYYGWTGQLQSMRPASESGGGSGGGGWGNQQQSLRGMASEFFPAPRNGRNPNSARVLACQGSNNATANCAAQSADRFCRSVGWNGSARQLMETENRRVYLADVLCVRSGF